VLPTIARLNNHEVALAHVILSPNFKIVSSSINQHDLVTIIIIAPALDQDLDPETGLPLLRVIITPIPFLMAPILVPIPPIPVMVTIIDHGLNPRMLKGKIKSVPFPFPPLRVLTNNNPPLLIFLLLPIKRI
jgi:hypothetical protein